MSLEFSSSQKKRSEKIERLRKYFSGIDSPQIYEWTGTDEETDFSRMSDADVAKYLGESA